MAGLPNDQPYPGTEEPMPFAFVGDDAFPLRKYLMKRNLSYEQRVYNYRINYRISRARRTVENAFGIMANRYKFKNFMFHAQYT